MLKQYLKPYNGIAEYHYRITWKNKKRTLLRDVTPLMRKRKGNPPESSHGSSLSSPHHLWHYNPWEFTPQLDNGKSMDFRRYFTYIYIHTYIGLYTGGYVGHAVM